jgi:5'-nucleotidase/UDP-sugar diphosphatase
VTKSIIPVLLASLVIVGCDHNKKKDASTMPMHSAALDIPAATPPPATFTPPPQPVITEAAAQQPVVGESAVADASESAYSAPAAAAPSHKMTSSHASARTASATGAKYTIKKGDSLWSIAQAKYGNGNKWKAIAAANPKLNPNKVQAGQTIVLP